MGGLITKFIFEVVKTIGWAFIGAFVMSASLWILIKTFDAFTPIDEWKELEKGNIAVGIVLAALILSFGYVIGRTIGGI